ncbi:MAG TPA: hypothetical protein VG895_04355 [Patescibacteria group bacterium]|nr:hypothetical protein [Patescibacteria group bacterium]
MLKKIDRFIAKIEPPNWVLLISSFVFLLRIPSLFEPYYYGDEMIYLTLGNAVRNGLTLYSQIHDNKPPLIYILAAVAGNLAIYRAILLFWMLVTIAIFWHLTKVLFEKNVRAQQVAVTIFAFLTTLPLLEGQIVNAEIFLIGPTILAILLLLKDPTKKHIIIAGVAFAVAALFKIPAVFDIPVVIIYWLINAVNSKDIKIIIKRTVTLFIAFIIPIALTFVWYALHNAALDYFKAAFLENIGYLSSWSGNNQTSFVVRNAPLFIKGGIVLLGLIILRIKSSKLSKSFLIAAIWLLTSLFAATLSGRPYPHYMIQVVPAFSLLIAILVTSQKFEQVLAIIPLSLVPLALVYYHFWYYPTFPYYENFISFATGQESKWQYFNNIDKSTEDNYNTAKLIMLTSANSDKVFVWGEEAPTIYALSHRLPPIKYAADYHITDFSSLPATVDTLSNNPPKLIVLLHGSPEIPGLNILLNKEYAQISNSEINSQIWKLLKN